MQYWTATESSIARTFHYSAFGLSIRANLPLPGLLPLKQAAGQDLCISLSGLPSWCSASNDRTLWHESPYYDERGEPSLRIWKFGEAAYLWFVYQDGVQVVVDRRGTHIWATWPEAMTLEDASTYLLGPVLAFALRLRGLTTLHASAVRVGESAVAFMGPQGAGKSTTAAAMANRGFSVLTDDVVALCDLEDSFVIQPAHPYLCLWPEAAQALYGARDSLPPLTPNWDKCYLDVTQNGYTFQQEPLALGAVYFLGPRSDDTIAPLIEDVSPQEGLMALTANSYGALRIDRQMRAREFDLLARIASRIRLRRITPHADPARLSELCAAIIADTGRSIQSASGRLKCTV
jgi:hypothetical protein